MFENTKWGKELEQCLGQVTDEAKIDNLDPVACGDTIVGVLPDALRRLRVLTEQTTDKRNALVSRHGSCNPQRCADRRQLTYLDHRLQLLDLLFWAMVRQEFDVPNDSMGIRDDNQVVIIRDTESQSASLGDSIFERFFGRLRN